MAAAGHPDGLSFGMERILRLDSPPSARQGEPDSTSGGPSDRWPRTPLLALPSAGLLCPLLATSGRTPPSSPPPPAPPVPSVPPPPRPLLLPLKPPLYPFCAPPLPPYLLGGRPVEPHRSCPACPDLWPMACHHLLQGSESRFPPSLVSGRRLGARRKRTWTRAVFTNLQRKGLEKRFTVQRYITKPERRKLADTLGLTDSQVKVWFQNRRMKWRNSRQAAERAAEETPVADSTQPSADDDSAQPINVED